jgi:ribosomal protein L19
MSLGVKQSRIYLNVKDGKIIQGDQTFDYVKGDLVDIRKQTREFNGEEVVYWYFDLQSQEGKLYSLALHYSSGVVKSILNSLSSATSLKNIQIEPYQSGGFTKAVVKSNGEKLSWKYQDLPPVEEVKVGNKLVKDDSKRMEFFEGIALEIVNRINGEIDK